MTSDIRREALALLADVWQLSPDVRLGQLLAHLGFLGETHLGHSLGDIEDDELMAILERHKAELQGRLQGMAEQGKPQTGATLSVSGSSNLLGTSPAAEFNR
jgi:uncharacterized protein YihD (DUF1040 family)